VDIVKIDSIDCMEKVDGWFKIDLAGAKTFNVHISLDKDESKSSSAVQLPVFLATSTSPNENSTTKVHVVKSG
jgi:hypothetical protein